MLGAALVEAGAETWRGPGWLGRCGDQPEDARNQSRAQRRNRGGFIFNLYFLTQANPTHTAQAQGERVLRNGGGRRVAGSEVAWQTGRREEGPERGVPRERVGTRRCWWSWGLNFGIVRIKHQQYSSVGGQCMSREGGWNISTKKRWIFTAQLEASACHLGRGVREGEYLESSVSVRSLFLF